LCGSGNTRDIQSLSHEDLFVRLQHSGQGVRIGEIDVISTFRAALQKQFDAGFDKRFSSLNLNLRGDLGVLGWMVL
jgi:hypothetical protein